jgi:hypothetical protein
MGGPIMRDKAWSGDRSAARASRSACSASSRRAHRRIDDADDLESDLTVLNNQNLKLNYAWTNRHKTTFLYTRGDKIRNARGADSTTRDRSDQPPDRPNNYYKASINGSRAID